jgi:hypothetical protein
LYLSTLLLLAATFIATNSPTANYFFIRPVLSYLAVATATWQHWPDRSLKSSSASLSDRRSWSRWSWFSQQLLSWPSVRVFFLLVGSKQIFSYFCEGFSTKFISFFFAQLARETGESFSVFANILLC